MQANICVYKDSCLSFSDDYEKFEVEVLKSFKFRDRNFFIHKTPDWPNFFIVSHFETGLRIRKPIGCFKLITAQKEAISHMKRIKEEKFNQKIEEVIFKFKINKTEDFKIV